MSSTRKVSGDRNWLKSVLASRRTGTFLYTLAIVGMTLACSSYISFQILPWLLRNLFLLLQS